MHKDLQYRGMTIPMVIVPKLDHSSYSFQFTPTFSARFWIKRGHVTCDRTMMIPRVLPRREPDFARDVPLEVQRDLQDACKH